MTEKATASPQPATREQHHEILIDAPKEAVWKALVDGEELSRWFVERAEVEPGEGGRHWVDWGDGQEMEVRHLVWEPGRRLQMGAAPGEAGDGPAMIEDYTLESRGGKTLLRLVFSGVPEGEAWDSMYDGTDAGYRLFLHTLGFYLERRAGEKRRTVYRYGKVGLPRAEAWRKLLGEVLAAGGALDGAKPGERYALTAADGERLEGEVVLFEPDRLLALSLDGLDDGLFGVTLHPTGEGTYVNAIVSTYGLGDGAYAAAKARWERLLDERFPIEGAHCTPA